MSELIRRYNWGATSIGPIASWPESLRSAANLMLGCGFPTSIWWGGDGLQFYNDAYVQLMADKHPAGLGMLAKDCWKEAWPLIGPQIHFVMEHGRPVFIENGLVPVKRHGALQDVYWTYSYSPIFGASGSTEGVLVMGQDVTDAVVSARKLKESTEELKQVLEATNDAVVSVDRDWKMTYFNPKAEAMYGPSHERTNQTVWEAFPDAVYDGSPFVEHYHRAMNEGTPAHFEAHYPDPLNIWLDLEVYPTRNGIVVFSRDVSELKHATAALLQTEKLAAVGRLAASIAHEINNPLESVTNLLYLARTTQDSGEIQEYLNTAERELRRVSAISNQTLRFYKQSTHATSVSCQDLFESVLSIYQGRLVNSRIHVETRKRACHPVKCFEGEIRQVLNNLVGNAIDAMHPAGGRLLLRSREAHNWKSGQKGIVLTVADTGHGMTPHVLTKVFEAFYTTKGIGGTGLGLWVSKEIVDRHNGTLRLRSSHKEGRSGTVFTLFLPADAASR